MEELEHFCAFDAKLLALRDLQARELVERGREDDFVVVELGKSSHLTWPAVCTTVNVSGRQWMGCVMYNDAHVYTE